MVIEEVGRWRRACYSCRVSSMTCATCRKLIALGAAALRCSVASCNTGRLKLRFCCKACWESHVPTARHRGATYTEEVPATPRDAG